MTLLEHLRSWASRQRPVTITDVLADAHRTRFTGQIVVHFQNGIPQRVEGGRPVQVDLYTLDLPQPSSARRQHLTQQGTPSTLHTVDAAQAGL